MRPMLTVPLLHHLAQNHSKCEAMNVSSSLRMELKPSTGMILARSAWTWVLTWPCPMTWLTLWHTSRRATLIVSPPSGLAQLTGKWNRSGSGYQESLFQLRCGNHGQIISPVEMETAWKSTIGHAQTFI